MKLVAVYYFNNKIKKDEWPIIVDNLNRLYPNIMWWAGGSPITKVLGGMPRILYIYQRGSDFKMKYADYVSIPEGQDISWTVDSYAKNNGGQLINGEVLIQPDWDETESMFDQLNEEEDDYYHEENIFVFSEPIQAWEWDTIVDNLLKLYPEIKWDDGDNLYDFNPAHYSTTKVLYINNKKYMTYSNNLRRETHFPIYNGDVLKSDTNDLDTYTLFDQLSETIKRIVKESVDDDLGWAEDIVNVTHNFPIPSDGKTYFIFIGRDRPVEWIKSVFDMLSHLGWITYTYGSNDFYELKQYSKESDETYLVLHGSNRRIKYGPNLEVLTEINGLELYNQSPKIYL